MSTVLSKAQRRGLDKLGDALIPGDGTLPSFTESGCAAHADRMLSHMYDDDRSGVTMVLSLCSVLPPGAIAALFRLTDRHAKAPEPIAGILRMANLGVKGVVMTLYYSGISDDRIFGTMGWDPVVNRDNQGD